MTDPTGFAAFRDQMEHLRTAVLGATTPPGFDRVTVKMRGHTVSWVVPQDVTEGEARQLRAAFEDVLKKRRVK